MMNKPNPFGDSINTFLTIVFRSFIIFIIAFGIAIVAGLVLGSTGAVQSALGIAMIAASIDFNVAVLTTDIRDKKEQ